MKQFDLTTFLRMCVITVESFKRVEEKKYPQNDFILKSSEQINEEFQRILDAARFDVGLQPDEVYITLWADGVSTANLGSTLLARKVIFSERCDIQKLSREARKKGKFFSFELYFFEKYQLAYRVLEMMAQEISEAHKARDVPVDERARVLQALEEEYKARYLLLRMLSKKKYVTQEKEEIQKHLNHLDVLISKLKQIHKGHY